MNCEWEQREWDIINAAGSSKARGVSNVMFDTNWPMFMLIESGDSIILHINIIS